MRYFTRWGQTLLALLLLLAGAGPARAQRIASGGSHTVSIHADGTLWAWGSGSGLGLGANVGYQPTPVQVGAATTWQQVTAGPGYTLALRADGTLWAWGDNQYGQLGLGSITLQATPAQVGTATWKTVSTSTSSHTLAVRQDGTLWSWGRNDYGQLGNGTSGFATSTTAPGQVGTGTTWSSVSAGSFYSAALRADGTLWVWGANDQGQLGLGTTTNQLTPVQLSPGTTWQRVSLGDRHALAVRQDGTLWSWGVNFAGQLGTGTTTAQATPAQVGTDATWSSVAAGYQYSLALRQNGTLWSWGDNTYGQLGNGSTARGTQLTPLQAGSATPWASVAAGYHSAVALRQDGSLWTWGENTSGQLGDGTGLLPSPTPVTPPSTWRSVAAGMFSAGIKTDGTLWTWGGNYNGQLGTGSTLVAQNAPAQVGTNATWQTVATGNSHGLAIRQDGTLWSWGSSYYGQLGNGSTVGPATPAQVGTATWKAVAGGVFHSLGIRQDGSLWAWGGNDYGQLGTGPGNPTPGSPDRQLSPVRVGTATTWVSVACGIFYSLALRSDGTLWVWGYNAQGQLGLGTTTNQFTPVQLGTATWLSVAGGDTHTVAVRADGTLWSWGGNDSGQLGSGSAGGNPRLTPAQVGTATTWRSVAAGLSHSLALRQDNTLWAWGANYYGQLGLGSVSGAGLVPTQVGSASWQALAPGAGQSLALRADGTLWAWGYNDNGRAGQPDFAPGPVYIRNGGTPLGAASPAAAAGWALAPNPAHNAVQVLGLPTGPVAVRLYDATGQLVREAGAATVPTAGLAPGLYLLRATAAGASRTLRLVVE